jgi:N-acetylmuramoyl-L-alanine amidase
VRSRFLALGSLSITAVIAIVSIAGQPVVGQDRSGLVIVSPDGERTLPTVAVGGREMVSLTVLAEIFDLTVFEDAAAGGITVTHRGRTIVLAPDQTLASVGGRLVSLPAPAVRASDGWLVPFEFISRALALVHSLPLELRPASRLVVVGNLRVPRVLVRYELVGDRARVTIEPTPRTSSTVRREPGRLLVTFDADRLDVALPVIGSSALVEGISVADEPSTLAIALGPAFASYEITDGSGVAGATRLTIELRTSSLEISSAPEPARPDPDRPSPMFERPRRPAIRTIVLDPGHGGDDAGAHGAGGTLEKNVTLGVARRLAAMVESRLGLRVLLTRQGDQTVRLDERAAVANNNKADLFISLHANASLHASVAGAEVFYLSVEEYGTEASRLTSIQSPVLPVFGGGQRAIDVVQWDMAQVGHLDESTILARTVAERLAARIPMSERALQPAPFRVLAGANMPAVLVEMGFMTNPTQESALASGEFQNDVAQALFESVVSFRGYVESRGMAERGREPGSPASHGPDAVSPAGSPQ